MRNNPKLVNEILEQFKTVTKEEIEEAIKLVEAEVKENESKGKKRI